MAHIATATKPFESISEEDVALERLGYQQGKNCALDVTMQNLESSSLYRAQTLLWHARHDRVLLFHRHQLVSRVGSPHRWGRIRWSASHGLVVGRRLYSFTGGSLQSG